RENRGCREIPGRRDRKEPGGAPHATPAWRERNRLACTRLRRARPEIARRQVLLRGRLRMPSAPPAIVQAWRAPVRRCNRIRQAGPRDPGQAAPLRLRISPWRVGFLRTRTPGQKNRRDGKRRNETKQPAREGEVHWTGLDGACDGARGSASSTQLRTADHSAANSARSMRISGPRAGSFTSTAEELASRPTITT